MCCPKGHSVGLQGGVPKEEATADPLLGSTCIFTDAIFPGIIHIGKDCPRGNHYPVL